MRSLNTIVITPSIITTTPTTSTLMETAQIPVLVHGALGGFVVTFTSLRVHFAHMNGT
jgi:hypothetical protein